MIDTWLDIWLDTYSTVCYPHYCLFTYSCYFLFQFILLSYVHIYMNVHLPFYSYTFTKSSNFLELHNQICSIYCWSGIWRGSQTSWGARVLLHDSPVSVSFLLFLIPIIFMILYIGLMIVLFHFLFHLRSCVNIICIIAVMLILHSDFIARFKLSVRIMSSLSKPGSDTKKIMSRPASQNM